MKALPTLKQLRYLAALADHLHFGQAAEACFVTQSTLSAGIAELETLLDAALVDRTKRTVIFTPLGEEIVGRGRAILRAAEDLVSVADAAREPLTEALRLGVIPTIGPYLLPGVLPALRAAYPSLKLYLREDQTARLVERLAAGELDVLLMALPYACGDVETRVIGTDPFLAALPEDHPLAVPARVPLAALASEPLLLLEDGHCMRDHALAACQFQGARQRNQFEATSLPTLVQMAANGLGLTLVPELAARNGVLAGTGLVTRPLEGERPGREIALVWRKGAGRSAEYGLLADFLATHLASAIEGPRR
jgi:LysR family hydrogen peroxide-inducible transcriptional activator